MWRGNARSHSLVWRVNRWYCTSLPCDTLARNWPSRVVCLIYLGRRLRRCGRQTHELCVTSVERATTNYHPNSAVSGIPSPSGSGSWYPNWFLLFLTLTVCPYKEIYRMHYLILKYLCVSYLVNWISWIFIVYTVLSDPCKKYAC